MKELNSEDFLRAKNNSAILNHEFIQLNYDCRKQMSNVMINQPVRIQRNCLQTFCELYSIILERLNFIRPIECVPWGQVCYQWIWQTNETKRSTVCKLKHHAKKNETSSYIRTNVFVNDVICTASFKFQFVYSKQTRM